LPKENALEIRPRIIRWAERWYLKRPDLPRRRGDDEINEWEGGGKNEVRTIKLDEMVGRRGDDTMVLV